MFDSSDYYSDWDEEAIQEIEEEKDYEEESKHCCAACMQCLGLSFKLFV